MSGGPRPLSILLLGLLAATTACTPPPQGEGEAESLTGCYRFEQSEGAEALGLPWGVELTADDLEEGWPILEEQEGIRAARTLLSAGERTDHPFGYWRITESDSVEVGHPGGGGVVLVLAADEEALVGRGRSAGDALSPGQEAKTRRTYSVRAVLVECAGVGDGGSVA